MLGEVSVRNRGGISGEVKLGDGRGIRRVCRGEMVMLEGAEILAS